MLKSVEVAKASHYDWAVCISSHITSWTFLKVVTIVDQLVLPDDKVRYLAKGNTCGKRLLRVFPEDGISTFSQIVSQNAPFSLGAAF